MIVIPPNATALIHTNETIWVSEKICGSYHSKVYWSSKGLGHIGTTLDPKYIGPSLIPVHNHSDKEIIIKPEKDTFVSVMFSYVKTKSSVSDTNRPGRLDILQNYNISEEEYQWLDEPFRKEYDKLKSKFDVSEEFQRFKKEKNWLNQFSYFLSYLILILLLIISIIIYVSLILFSASLSTQTWYNVFLAIADRAIFVFFTTLFMLITTDLRK